MIVPVSPYLHQPLLFSVLFASLMDKKCFLIVLIWIPPQLVMSNIFSCNYWPFKLPVHNLSNFLHWVIFFLLTSLNYLYILGNNLLKLECVVNIGTSFVNFKAALKINWILLVFVLLWHMSYHLNQSPQRTKNVAALCLFIQTEC